MTIRSGALRIAVPLILSVGVGAVAPSAASATGNASTASIGSTSSSATVAVQGMPTLVRLSASPTVMIEHWWKVSGVTAPPNTWTALQLWKDGRWANSSSHGYSGSDGSFARYWNPTSYNGVGDHKLRLVIGRVEDGDTPVYRVLNVKVMPRYSAFIDGRVSGTNTTVIRQGTKMSTFGHLKVGWPGGTLRPFANRTVHIEVKLAADTHYAKYVGHFVTNSKGYYYGNWKMPYAAGSKVVVRARFATNESTVYSSAKVLGTIQVR